MGGLAHLLEMSDEELTGIDGFDEAAVEEIREAAARARVEWDEHDAAAEAERIAAEQAAADQEAAEPGCRRAGRRASRRRPSRGRRRPADAGQPAERPRRWRGGRDGCRTLGSSASRVT